MSGPMRKRHTKNHTLNIVYQGNVYHIPLVVANQYKLGSIKRVVPGVKKDSVLAEDLFAELEEEYTKAGVLLKGVRHREGLSQVEFAKRIGVTQSDLSKLERGKRTIGKTIAKRIADEFDVDYRYFLE
jgi:DNA-binding XRE family transcriptional regulator